MKIKILVTCIGGKFSIPILKALKNSKVVSPYIIGCDFSPFAPGRFICDQFYSVPHAGDEPTNFWERFNEIINIEKPDFILPLSESETILTSEHILDVTKQGAILPFARADLVRLLLDKFSLLSRLRDFGIDVGPFSSIDHIGDLGSLYELGYPHDKVVIKPRSGSGSRGVIIVDEHQTEFHNLVDGRLCGIANLETVKDMFEKINYGSGYLAMPFYGPDTFDVDCVFFKDERSTIIPRLREYQNPLSPVNQGCSIDLSRDSDIIDYVKTIGGALNIKGICDFDITRNKCGALRILDASCRLSGSVTASMTMGYPIIDLMLASRLDLNAPSFNADNSGRLRPFTDFFIT